MIRNICVAVSTPAKKLRVIPSLSLIAQYKTVNRPEKRLRYAADPYNTKVGGITPIPENATIDEVVANIDTKITPDQKAYVDKLLKSARGAKGSRSLYRDVPKPEELATTGNFISKIAPNAQELIDYAFSHVPKRDGKRQSRHLKRMEHRKIQISETHARRKSETKEAKKKKQAKKLRQLQLVKLYTPAQVEVKGMSTRPVEKQMN